MILQQYYTRERRGIFRTTEGYDTIAKSPSLDKNLIKKVFHSYCFYDPPRELQVAGEKDSQRYPKSLTFLQLETSDTILGQSIYVPVDFTGQRSTFFTHNYLLPRNIKEDFIKNPEKILYANEFKESYDIEQGMDLEEISDIAYIKQNYDMNFANDLFEQLGLTEELFKLLVSAVCVSVASRKKIYIALDVEASEIATYAKKLLLCILESLPYEIRRKVGFISYIQKPESKKGVNIMFVDKESIRHGTSGADQDFIFDFSNNRFPNLKTDPQEHYYLDFIWTNRGNKNITIPLFEFIDQVLSYGNLKTLVDISTYSNLCVLYQTIGGNDSIYNKFKDQIFEYILLYLNEKNISEQSVLIKLATNLIGKELGIVGAGGAHMSIEFAQNLVRYYPLANQENKINISKLFLYSLFNGKNMIQKEYILGLFEMLQSSGAMLNQVMKMILGNSQIKALLLNDYLSSRLDKITKIDQWGKELEDLRNIAGEIIEEPYFQIEATQTLLHIIGKQNNVATSSKRVYKILADFEKGSTMASRMSDVRYVDTLKDQVDTTVLKNISIKQITTNDLMNLTLSPNNQSQKVKILDGLKDFIILKGFHAKRNMKKILDQVSSAEKDEIQEAIKNLVITSPSDSFYEELILGFYKGEQSASEEYSYKELLIFIYTKKGKASVYNFIFWSLDKEGFYNKSTKGFYKGYATAIKSYFLKLDPEAFKDKTIKQKFCSITRPRVRRVFTDINYELASGFEKIFLKYGDRMFVVTKYLLIIGIVGTGIVFGTIKITALIMEKRAPSTIIPIETELKDNKLEVEPKEEPKEKKLKEERSLEQKMKEEQPQYEQFWKNRLEEKDYAIDKIE